ncbi:hypothetical protein CMI47_22700 [Candidatus Pacearchaeota archaeon]|nr:hypothetical protein [Candidatus Pacearchaeota archaeon]
MNEAQSYNKMFTKKQLEEIKEHLEKAQNPLFYYDNDADGLCSFLILRRFLGRGKGVAIRGYPGLSAQNARKADELKADYVFVLDKPEIPEDFAKVIDELGLPLVWIDHHGLEYSGPEISNFFPYVVKTEKPITYWSYKLTERKEDLWLAVVGCIADHYLPEFSKEFAEEYPEYWGKGIKEPFDAVYRTEIGEIAKGFNFGLKDSTTRVVKLQNYLIEAKNPGDVFAEVPGNKEFREKYDEIKKKYDSLVDHAKEQVSGKLIFFEYGGDMSISSEISNEISYYYPDRYVVIAYKKGGIANLSLRGEGIRMIQEKALKEIEGARGGGHDNAVGAKMGVEDLSKFRELLEKEIGK